MTAVARDGAQLARRQWLTEADGWLQSRFALFGALRRCRGQHWWAATVEFAITIVFAILPLAIPFVALPMFGRDISPLDSTLWSQIENGELYLLSTALLAPLYYFTFPKRGNGATSVIVFPSQQALILIFIATICIAVLAIAATKVQAEGAQIPPGMILFSQYLFFFCCLVFFLTLAVKHSLPDTVEQAYDEESLRQQNEIPPNDRPQKIEQTDPEEFVRQTLAAHSVGGEI
jgi:hypothetical protein